MKRAALSAARKCVVGSEASGGCGIELPFHLVERVESFLQGCDGFVHLLARGSVLQVFGHIVMRFLLLVAHLLDALAQVVDVALDVGNSGPTVFIHIFFGFNGLRYKCKGPAPQREPALSRVVSGRIAGRSSERLPIGGGRMEPLPEGRIAVEIVVLDDGHTVSHRDLLQRKERAGMIHPDGRLDGAEVVTVVAAPADVVGMDTRGQRAAVDTVLGKQSGDSFHAGYVQLEILEFGDLF